MADAAHDLAGELIDRRFRVECLLGTGGMGAVWQVQHIESLQRFALKTLAPDFALDKAVTDRFLREARAAAALRTRHVVRITDVHMGYRHQGEALPFLVMELLEGFDLERLVRARGRLTPGQTVWVLRQVARALGVAHRRGIVHRDLKPANVFIALDEEGEPTAKLCDFGIAKLFGDSARALAATGGLATSAGVVLGTPLYMAPEQLRASSGVGPATDLWAFALIAFRVLSGLEYFGESTNTTELLLKITRDPLPVPSRLSVGLSATFDTWFMRSCAREPADRFGSVNDQLAELEAALGHPVPEAIAPVLDPERPLAASRNLVARGVVARSTHAGRGLPGPARLALTFATGVMTLGLMWWLLGATLPTLDWAMRAALGRIAPGPAPVPAQRPIIQPIARDSAGATTGSLAASAQPTSGSITPANPSRTPASTSTPRAGRTPPVSTIRRSTPPTTDQRGHRAAGEPCDNSTECQSGLCLAEACR
jgi:hypothetical protein